MDRKGLHQYEAIRRSGKVNMLDQSGVRLIAMEHGFNEMLEYMGEQGYSEILKNYDRDEIIEEEIPEVR